MMDLAVQDIRNDAEGLEEIKLDSHTPVGSKSKISFKNNQNYKNYSVLNKWPDLQNKAAPKGKSKNIQMKFFSTQNFFQLRKNDKIKKGVLHSTVFKEGQKSIGNTNQPSERAQFSRRTQRSKGSANHYNSSVNYDHFSRTHNIIDLKVSGQIIQPSITQADSSDIGSLELQIKEMRDNLHKQALESVSLKDREKHKKELQDQQRRVLEIQYQRERMKNNSLNRNLMSSFQIAKNGSLSGKQNSKDADPKIKVVDSAEQQATGQQIKIDQLVKSTARKTCNNSILLNNSAQETEEEQQWSSLNKKSD